jgi:regulator of sigma E protease
MLIFLIVIVGLSILILGHEAGHFLCAKLFGLKVDEFGIGFPPRIFSIRRYRGMNVVPVATERETIDVTERDAMGNVIEETIVAEREIDTDIPVTKWRFFWGKQPEKDIKGLAPGDTVYSVNWLPFGGFVRISGERGEFAMVEDNPISPATAESANSCELADRENSPGDQLLVADHSRLFFTQPAWKKSIIVIAGIMVNFILGWLLISAVLMIGTPKALVITGIEAGSPAATVHIAAGDVVKNFTDAQSFINFVNAHRGQPTEIILLRNGKEVDITVTPRVNVGPNEGAIGVALSEGGTVREPFFQALWDGLRTSFILAGMIFQVLWQLIRSLFAHGTLLAGVVGPVGIFGVAEQTGRIGFIYLVQLLGIISLNLAVVNLIPFPALDGGRFLMVIIEKIKGSAIPEKVEAWVNGLGFAFLLLLMLLLTIRDVRGLF